MRQGRQALAFLPPAAPLYRRKPRFSPFRRYLWPAGTRFFASDNSIVPAKCPFFPVSPVLMAGRHSLFCLRHAPLYRRKSRFSLFRRYSGAAGTYFLASGSRTVPAKVPFFPVSPVLRRCRHLLLRLRRPHCTGENPFFLHFARTPLRRLHGLQRSGRNRHPDHRQQTARGKQADS